MGGALNNKKIDKRVLKKDMDIWRAIVSLSEDTVDEFAFTAEDVSRWLGKENSGTTITRNRGGLKHMICHKREEFLEDIKQLVNEEATNTGEISLSFCRKLGFLISVYNVLFVIDIVQHSYRNTELLLEPVRVLINEKVYLLFGPSFYLLLVRWYHEDGFTRESVLEKYENRIRALFLRYQVVRPDMSVASRG